MISISKSQGREEILKGCVNGSGCKWLVDSPPIVSGDDDQQWVSVSVSKLSERAMIQKVLVVSLSRLCDLPNRSERLSEIDKVILGLLSLGSSIPLGFILLQRLHNKQKPQ